MKIGHECSYYCRAGLHCELIYTNLEPRAWDRDDARYVTSIVRESYAEHYGKQRPVVRVEPAREAPVEPPYAARVQLAGSGVGKHAYLVFIREP